MKNTYLLLLLTYLLCVTACRKTYTYTCNDPQIVIEQQGYDSTEWDTVIVRYFDRGYTTHKKDDTFVAGNIDNVLLLSPGTNGDDLEIYLPSVNCTYRLSDIRITENTY